MKQKIPCVISRTLLVLATYLVIPNSFAELNCTSLVNKVVIDNSKICISQKRLPDCNLGCISTDYTTKIVTFKCFLPLDLDPLDILIPLEPDNVALEVTTPTNCTIDISN